MDKVTDKVMDKVTDKVMDKVSDNEDLDWLDDEQRMLNIQQNPVREPMKSIRGVFIFINQQHYIDKIVVEDIVRYGEH
jgi:CO dehydrogenase/acetyl-CoA synthase beta subunit